jgi:hypothetical protein
MGAWAFGSMGHRLSSVQPQTLQTPFVFGIGVFLESTLPHLDELFDRSGRKARIMIVYVKEH